MTPAGILPYSYVVGQEDLKQALELAYVDPRIGGVLISGERGTAKSTAVRAFSVMMYGKLPVTLPLNATDDRVLGGYDLKDLMSGRVSEQPGLLEEARGGTLYVDEVNLLDDHIVNVILDVTATGVLTVQREAIDKRIQIDFTFVGTMNPEEGGLRPQLLDRFGLYVAVGAETNPKVRAEILSVVLQMDEARSAPDSQFIVTGLDLDAARCRDLVAARERLNDVAIEPALATCAAVAAAFEVAGHRGDVMMARASRALAAMKSEDQVSDRHVIAVAPFALQHRLPAVVRGAPVAWSAEDQQRLESTAAGAAAVPPAASRAEAPASP